jgi:hypothetical protein
MRWTSRGAHVVLQLRAAAPTLNRWNAFWRKISLYGVMIEAHRTIIPPDPLYHLGITPLLEAVLRCFPDQMESDMTSFACSLDTEQVDLGQLQPAAPASNQE